MNDTQPTTYSKSRESVTATEVVAFVLNRWKGTLACAVICALVAASICLLIQPTFRASATVMEARSDDLKGGVASLSGGIGNLASLAGLSLQDGSRDKYEAMAILRSRAFAAEMIQSQDMLPLFFPSDWNSQTAQWRSKDKSEIPTLQDGIEYFSKKLLSVVEDRDRGVVILTVEWRDRVQAASWANMFIDKVNEEIRLRRIAELDRNIGYMERELERTSVVELRTALSTQTALLQQKRTLAESRIDYAFRSIDPAVAPDEDKVAWPRKKLLAAVGFVAGAVAWLLSISAIHFWRHVSSQARGR